MSLKCLAEVAEQTKDSAPARIRGLVTACSAVSKSKKGDYYVSISLTDASLLKTGHGDVQAKLFKQHARDLPAVRDGFVVELGNVSFVEHAGTVYVVSARHASLEYVVWRPAAPAEFVASVALDQRKAKEYFYAFYNLKRDIEFVRAYPFKITAEVADAKREVEDEFEPDDEDRDAITRRAVALPGHVLLRDLKPDMSISAVVHVVAIDPTSSSYVIRVTDYTQNPLFHNYPPPPSVNVDTKRIVCNMTPYDGNLKYIVENVKPDDVVLIETLRARMDTNRTALEARINGDRQDRSRSFVRKLAPTDPAAVALLRRKSERMTQARDRDPTPSPEDNYGLDAMVTPIGNRKRRHEMTV